VSSGCRWRCLLGKENVKARVVDCCQVMQASLRVQGEVDAALGFCTGWKWAVLSKSPRYVMPAGLLRVNNYFSTDFCH
jgi:hypothetical protein